MTVSVLTAAQLLARPCCVARACRLNGAPGFRRAAPLLPSRASRLCELPHDPPELSCARLSQHPSSHSTPLYNTAVPLRGSDAPPQRTHVSLFLSRCGTKPFPHITFLYVSCREQAALLARSSTTSNPRLTQDTRVRIHFLSRTPQCSCTALMRRPKPTPVLYLPALWYQPVPSHRTSLVSLTHPADGSAVGCDRRSVAQE